MGCTQSKPLVQDVEKIKAVSSEINNGCDVAETQLHNLVGAETEGAAEDMSTPQTDCRCHNRFYEYESKRAESTKALNLFQVTTAESRFSNITNLMASVFHTPVSSITIFGKEDCFLKASYGGYTGTFNRTLTMCDSLMISGHPQLLIVEDTLLDARYSTNVFVVGEPHVRFYAGAPLVGSDGYRYGTLCVVDFKPRAFPTGLYNTLMNFAELVVREMERDKTIQQHKRVLDSATEMLRDPQAFRQPVAFLDVERDAWKVLYVNDAWSKTVGVDVDKCTELSIWDMLHSTDSTMAPKDLLIALNERRPFSFTVSKSPEQVRPSPTTPLVYRKSEDNGSAAPSSVQGDVATANPTQSFDGNDGFTSGFVPPEEEYILTLHPADVDALEQGTLVGIPSYIRLSGSSDDETSSNKSFTRPTTLWFAAIETRANVDKAVAAYAAGVLEQLEQEAIEELAEQHQQQQQAVLQRYSPPTQNSSSRPLAPAFISDIKLGALVGTGSFGKVYRAKFNGRPVAVKILEILFDSKEYENTLQEGVLSKSLDHPNIVGAIEYGEVSTPIVTKGSLSTTPSMDSTSSNGGRPPSGMEASKGVFGAAFEALNNSRRARQTTSSLSNHPPAVATDVWIVQQYCDRGTLNDAVEKGWLRQERVYNAPPKMLYVLATALEIASAMKYLHSRGILHGDLNGNNVLLKSSSKDSRGFEAMVTDFGMSIVLQGVERHTESIGTVSHMSPELLSEGLQTKAADTYSFGVILWELFNGVRAYLAQRPGQIVFRIMQGKSLPFDGETTPAAFKELAERCMSFKHQDRPSFGEICDDISKMITDESIQLQ